MPSTASVVTLLATTAATAGIIWAVHNEQVLVWFPYCVLHCWPQVTSRAKLHAGIERDLERQVRTLGIGIIIGITLTHY